MNSQGKKAFAPIVIVFLCLSGLILFSKNFLLDHGFDIRFLLFANIFLLLLSIGGFLLQRKGLQSSNPNAFVRGMYSSLMFKMFITMFAVLIYAFLLRSKINKPGLFTAMGMYIVYTVGEVKTLMKLARKKRNA